MLAPPPPPPPVPTMAAPPPPPPPTMAAPPPPPVPTMAAPPPLPPSPPPLPPGVAALATMQAPPPPPVPSAASTMPPPPPVAGVLTDVDEKLRRYIALRDEKAQIETRQKAELAPLNDEMNTLAGLLLGHLNATGSDSQAVRGVGTVFKTTDTSVTIADGEAFRKFVLEHQAFDLLDWRASKTGVRAYIERTRSMVPGVNVRVDVKPSIRRAAGTASKGLPDSGTEPESGN